MSRDDRLVATNPSDLHASPVDLLVTGIGQLCTLDRPTVGESGPRRGEGLADLGLVPRSESQ